MKKLHFPEEGTTEKGFLNDIMRKFCPWADEY